MSVLEPNVVDGTAMSEDEKGLILFISDHLDWKSEEKHMHYLQNKINGYLMFCESKQYQEVYPGCEFEYGIIKIYFAKEISESGILFLNRIQEQIWEDGIIIECYIEE